MKKHDKGIGPLLDSQLAAWHGTVDVEMHPLPCTCQNNTPHKVTPLCTPALQDVVMIEDCL
jgi:hypothetical protein